MRANTAKFTFPNAFRVRTPAGADTFAARKIRSVCTHTDRTTFAPEHMNELIETRQATLEKTADNVVEVRYKPGQILDPAGLSDVLNERERLCGGNGSQAVLAVIPPDADFQMVLMTTDHYKGRPVVDCTRFLAISASSVMHERMASLYFAYFPQKFHTAIFSDEAAAREWLKKSMSGVSLS